MSVLLFVLSYKNLEYKMTTPSREYTIITVHSKPYKVRLAGSGDQPYFCGRDICEALGYDSSIKALQRCGINDEHKIKLKNLMVKFNPTSSGHDFYTTFMVNDNHILGKKNFSPYEGRMVFISEVGLKSLINGSQTHKNNIDLKDEIEKVLLNLKYYFGAKLANIFDFIKGSHLTIDIGSKWFQDLWYPLSISQPPLGGGLNMVEEPPLTDSEQNLWCSPITTHRPNFGHTNMVERYPIIITQNLLEWMGYKGRDQADKQERFSRLLESLKVEYTEIDYKHPLAIEYPCVQNEVNTIPKNNIEKKRWICMDQRAFKKMVMRLNTKNSDIVREYYINLEEAMIAYGHYTMNFLLEKSNIERKFRDMEMVETMARLAIKDKSEEELQTQLTQEKLLKEKAEREAEEEKLLKEKAEREAEEHKQYALVLKEIAINDQKRPLNELVYISTSRTYALNNRHKVGSVESMAKLNPRLSNYNGRSSVDDLWYYSDLFPVANAKAAEKRIEDILGRFRERKNKEIYAMHYTDIKRYVKWICEHYEDETEKFNEEINMLIGNLNKYNLRPIIPPPYQGTSATITRIVDGIPTHTTLESTVEEQFKHKIRVYLDTLEPTIKEIKRTDLFDKVDFNFNKIEAWKWLKEVALYHKPDLKLTYR